MEEAEEAEEAEAEEEEKIRLKHFMSPFVRRRDIITIDSNLEKTIQK